MASFVKGILQAMEGHSLMDQADLELQPLYSCSRLQDGAAEKECTLSILRKLLGPHLGMWSLAT